MKRWREEVAMYKTVLFGLHGPAVTLQASPLPGRRKAAGPVSAHSKSGVSMDACFIRRSTCSNRAAETNPATMHTTSMVLAMTNSSSDWRPDCSSWTSSSWTRRVPLGASSWVGASKDPWSNCRRSSLSLLLSPCLPLHPGLVHVAVLLGQRAHGDHVRVTPRGPWHQHHHFGIAVQRGLAAAVPWRWLFGGRSVWLGSIGARSGAASAHVSATCCRLAGWPEQLFPRPLSAGTRAALTATSAVLHVDDSRLTRHTP